MAKVRYIEKATGKWWYWCGCSNLDGVKEIHIREWNDNSGEYTNVPEDEFNERFECKPFDNPSIDVEPVRSSSSDTHRFALPRLRISTKS